MGRGVTSIRPEERRGTAAAFLTIFGILAAHTLLETARDALFLARLPASRLPWVYLIIALVAVGLSQVPWSSRRRPSSYGLPALLLACAGVTFLFWLTRSWRSAAGLYALYVWTGLVGSLAVLQFWLVLGDLYTVTQAKRLYSLIGTGSLLGAVAGAGLARVLTGSASAPVLVLAASAAMALTALGPAWLLGRAGSAAAAAPSRGPTSMVEAANLLRGQPYVRGLAGFVLVSTVALTLGDYVFKSAVSRNVAPGDLGEFFATVYVVLNLLGLLAQVLLTEWLFRVLGLHRALWALPILIFMGAAGVALGGGLGAALLLKGADGTLRNSLHRTGSELLFVPLPDALRSRAKPFIDLVGQRGGQALASLLILSEVVLNRGDSVLAAAAAALCLVWIAWAADLKSHYLDLFRVALREGSIRPAADLPPLDLGSLEALFSALNSADDVEVIGAMDLLSDEGRIRLIPALILHHPSRDVVLRGLDLFAREGRTDFIPVADRLLGHADPEVRAAALRARTRVKPDEGLLRAADGDPSPLVRATALVGLVSGGWIKDDAPATLNEVVKSGSAEARAALARAIREQPSPVFEATLLGLAEGLEEEVQVQTALAMGELPSAHFLPALLPLLAQREVRQAARAAFLRCGDEALAFLDHALADRHYPHEVRRHLPRTISLFEPVAAVAVLQRHLVDEPDGMVRFKVLRGLNRLAGHSEAVLDGAILRTATEATLAAAFKQVHWRRVLERGAIADPRRATPGHDLLVRLLRDKEAHALERIFRLLALQYRSENFKGIYRGLRNPSAKVKAGSRELLENLVPPPLRAPLLALVDDASDDERLVRAAPYYQARPLLYEELLAVVLDEPGESLRSIVAYHVGELGLQALRPRLERFRPADTGLFLSRVVERTLVLLAHARGGAAAHA